MLRIAPHGRRPAHGRYRIAQVGRRVGGAAVLAGVAVLVGRPAVRTKSLHVPIGQEHFRRVVVCLANDPPVDEAGAAQRQIHAITDRTVLGRVRRAEIVEADQHVLEIALVFGVHALDQVLGGHSFGLRLEHDRRAVGVVGADVVAFVAAELLEAHPDVGLHGLEQVAQMDGAVGVRQRAGDEDSASSGHAKLCHDRTPTWCDPPQDASRNCSNRDLLIAFLKASLPVIMRCSISAWMAESMSRMPEPPPLCMAFSSWSILP